MIIVMSGYSKSGKTKFVEKLIERFPNKFVSVYSANIHNFLNSTYSVFQDDNTIHGKSHELRDKATKDEVDQLFFFDGK